MARAPQPSLPPESAATTGGPSPHEAGGILTIDLGAVAANYKLLRGRVTPAECAAVVKADAYGCGIDQVTATLSRAGCQTFFVAHLSEARRVRAIAREAVIYVLNGFSSAAGAGFVETYARPVINSLVELAEWDHFVATSGYAGSAALHVDTGMNRLGLTIEEAAAIAAHIRSESHHVALLMSHFAGADRPAHPLNDQQIRQFREVRSLFRGIGSSLANSSGIFLDASAHCDLVRPGIALYGGNPIPGKPNPMQPVIELKAHILQVRNLGKGAAVGYGSTWTAKRESRIAVIAAGYADGISRAAAITEGAKPREVNVAGKRCRMVGRISMDLLALDVTDLPVSAVRRDQMVTLIGDGMTLEDVAAQAGTISYEVLTGLGPRYHRVWKG
ncbi:MAG: alanine racemase [Alphaproteobacteria bacterium]|nr:alanine racemase [Alphaproteobacteria bacterium]